MVPEGGWRLAESRPGAGRPRVKSGLYCPNQAGEPRTPSCRRSSSSWLSSLNVWRQGNSRNFPELGQLTDPVNFEKIQQDNFPERFTNMDLPWKQNFYFSLNKYLYSILTETVFFQISVFSLKWAASFIPFYSQLKPCPSNYCLYVEKSEFVHLRKEFLNLLSVWGFFSFPNGVHFCKVITVFCGSLRYNHDQYDNKDHNEINSS